MKPVSGTKIVSGNHGHMLLIQQSVGKILGGKAGSADIGKHIKSAFGQNTVDSGHIVEPGNHIVSPPLIFPAHFAALPKGFTKGGNGPPLTKGNSVGIHSFRKLSHQFNQMDWACAEANAEACHGKGLGAAVHNKRELLHSGLCGDGMIGDSVKENMTVYLIADDKKIMPDGQLRQLFHGVL